MLFSLMLACNTPATTAEGEAPKVNLPSPDAATAPVLDKDGSGVVASWTSGQVQYSELMGATETQRKLLEIEYLQGRYQLESQAMEELTMMAILDAEATSRSITLDELMKAEVEDKVAPPTEDEIAEFYPVVKRQLGNMPLEQARPQVEAALLNRAQGERMGAYIDELQVKYGVTIDLPYPDLPRIEVSADDDPSLGPDDAVVTIVEFADYQCGYCRKVYPTMVELVDQYEGKVRVVYRDYPLSGGNGGLEPSIAANCAGVQGQYWEMHEELMMRPNYSMSAINASAAKLGLDEAAFATCMTESAPQVQEIMNDFQDGRAAGVSGTPAFFINGVFLNGAVPKEQFEAVIDKELEG